jgi:release factor glutamine methyltransferase
MHWKELYNLFLNELTLQYGMDEAVAISRLCLEEIAGKNRFFILSNGLETVDPDTETAMLSALLQLKQHVPVQHLTGKAWFRNLHLKVSPHTLIPRPETDELVQLCINRIEQYNQPTVLDIGTGSGCIAISIKKEVERAVVAAIDVSPDALEVAKENASQHQTPINFMLIDFLDEVKWPLLGIYDFIISNPPYIPLEEKALMDINVTAHEPALALFVVNNNPLLFYQKIAQFSSTHLAKTGYIFMETHWQYAYEVAALFIAQGFDASVVKDFFDKERMVVATHRQKP